MKPLLNFLLLPVIFFSVSCNHRSSESAEVVAAQMQAMADSIQVALTVQPEDVEKPFVRDEYVYFNYNLTGDVAPGAEVTICNMYSSKISSVVLIFSSSKNKLSDITDENTKISYLEYETAIKYEDTLRTKLNFKAPEGWRKGNFDRVFLYKITTEDRGPFTPVILIK
ncbi:MAG: hypothetical protein IAF38_05825 [Bacteroidia bacterium]|nr:hypothetical protein [Bacteroidia bacterium]